MMIGMQEINFNNITDDLKKKNIIYGAGHNGKIADKLAFDGFNNVYTVLENLLDATLV